MVLAVPTVLACAAPVLGAVSVRVRGRSVIAVAVYLIRIGVPVMVAVMAYLIRVTVPAVFAFLATGAVVGVRACRKVRIGRGER